MAVKSEPAHCRLFTSRNRERATTVRADTIQQDRCIYPSSAPIASSPGHSASGSLKDLTMDVRRRPRPRRPRRSSTAPVDYWRLERRPAVRGTGEDLSPDITAHQFGFDQRG
jgi:hypothetical protein